MDNMKKKIISAVLAATIVITSAMPAFATPNQEVIENQQKYDELTQKIEDINNQIYTLNGEIEPLVQTIESNNAQMEQIKVEVENTEKEIETAKEEIEKTEEVLGKRIRELYKSGGQSSYIMLLFSADSFNDFSAGKDNRLSVTACCAYVSFPCFTGAVYGTSHYRNRYGLLTEPFPFFGNGNKSLFYLSRNFREINLSSSACRA